MDDRLKTKQELILEIQQLRKTSQLQFNQVEHTVLAQKHRFDVMGRISRISLDTATLEETLKEILGEFLSIFNCDRAWLLHPIEPKTSWQVSFERCREEWTGMNLQKTDIPIKHDSTEMFKTVLSQSGPLCSGGNSDQAVPDSITRDFSVQAQMMLALYPKLGGPWIMGIHHCTKTHPFTEEESTIFEKIGLQVTDILSNFIYFRDMTLSEKKYHGLFQTMTQGVVYHNAKGKIISANPASERILGLTLDQLRGHSSIDPRGKSIHEDGSSFPEKAHPSIIAIRTGRPVRDVVMGIFNPTEKHFRWISIDAIPHFNPGENTPDQVFSTFSDITERKQAEEKNQMSAAVFQNSAEGILVTDSNNKIISVNKAFTDITGYAENEVIDRDPSLLRSVRHNEDFYSEIDASLEDSGQWQGELSIQRKNEEIFPAWLTMTTVRNNRDKLINHVLVFSDITPLKRSQEQVDFLAFHDPLTRLPNRLLFSDRLCHTLKRAKREGHKVALLFLDLDHFKTINDSLGHPVGDILLQRVAERIKSMVRKEDTVARMSGDEFVVIVDRTEPQGVIVLAHKLMSTFIPPFLIKDRELHVTMSMGISIYPQDGKDNATLIKNADTAMYQAKEEGRNNYAFYTPALTKAVFKRLTLETELHRAIKKKELVLHYQPQYSLKSGALVGAEALIRWQHPKLGLLSPAQFIPYAEESDLIVSMGKWVLITACKQVRQWQDSGLSIERVGVNISGAQFVRGEIVKTVRDALKKSHLASKHLELEITESFFMKNTEWAIKALDQLQALGVSIAIDDFGTGYSSLSYLKQLPVDKLKIDQSFIQDLPEDLNDKAIAGAVLALAHGLHHKVTAEGVETEAQRDYLREMGCDESQGFLYSPPVPAEAFANFL